MNIIIFGPNGSGKGTQAYFLEKQFALKHLETGGIFRHNLTHHTELGKQIQSYIEQGILVPDSVTNPMMLKAIEDIPPSMGWLLDGYPRNKTQAIALINALKEHEIHVDFIIELKLERSIAKERLLGRRLCSNNPSHSNNSSIEAIAPTEKGTCRICDAELHTRADDCNEDAIDTRHDIYYDTENGTLAGLIYCKDILCANGTTRFITINATDDIDTVKNTLLEAIQ